MRLDADDGRANFLEALVKRISAHRSELPDSPVGHELADILGHSQAALERLGNGGRILLTLPHASPNVFFPRARVGWHAAELQGTESDTIHLRVVLTHTNFSDLGWRPYAWWILDQEANLRRVSMFTRNKKQSHATIASQNGCSTFPDMLTGHDRRAARMAALATDRAWCYINLMASIERSCGFSATSRTIYVRLEWLVEAALEVAGDLTSTGVWMRALLELADGARVIGAGGRLRAATSGETPFVYSNAINLAVLAALPSAEVLGGKKMESYWPEVQARIGQAARNSKSPAPLLKRLLVPEQAREEGAPPSPRLRRQLSEAGIQYSQGMALSLHGSLNQTI